ncbi:uncharacterized protein [Watersipora subatra]|uniref:uncharacterized protein n=1 Tax=Watersipora subatra TaxID=2589382 RepID=UPI00355BA86B
MKEKSTYPGIAFPPGCVMAQLQSKEGHKLGVCSTHITCKGYKYPALQILQMYCVEKHFEIFGKGIPAIFSADFNSHPDGVSYSYIENGALSEEALQNLLSADFDGQERVQHQRLGDVVYPLSLPRKYLSVYKSVMGREPEFTSCCETNNQEIERSCLDYILYTPESLSPSAVLDIPGPQNINTFPNDVFPSDHLPLYATFKFKDL